jgi:8-oxo-dGTP pyrophosphatase MutT (NUDIX family)
MLRVPRQVLVYLFRRRRDGSVEFLLLKRTEQHGGFWQGVSGAPEWEETEAEGAIREVSEETGFSIASSLKSIGFRYELRREGDPDGSSGSASTGRGLMQFQRRCTWLRCPPRPTRCSLPWNTRPSYGARLSPRSTS